MAIFTYGNKLKVNARFRFQKCFQIKVEALIRFSYNITRHQFAHLWKLKAVLMKLGEFAGAAIILYVNAKWFKTL